MSPTRQQTNATARFTCLGASCPDTCCKGWGMQVTEETLAIWRTEAPELLPTVAEEAGTHVMRRDTATDYCVKFDNGWCGIHRDYGDRLLGDACHFYPRITRALGEEIITGVGLSCPESARLLLTTHDAFELTPREPVREPYSLRNYLPTGVAAGEALALHRRFLEEAGETSRTAERNFARLANAARALDLQPKEKWGQAAELYFRLAESRLPEAEVAPADPFNLLNALQGLIAASNAHTRARLNDMVQAIAETLGATLDWETRSMALASDAAERAVRLLTFWRRDVSDQLQPLLRRYVQAQLSAALFPYAGLGGTLTERITIIGVRFATVKLALMAEALRTGVVPDEETVVRIVQRLSRFLDHLADPTLSLAIYKETGWLREPRLRALLGDE